VWLFVVRLLLSAHRAVIFAIAQLSCYLIAELRRGAGNEFLPFHQFIEYCSKDMDQ